jgi:hypothetical protein
MWHAELLFDGGTFRVGGGGIFFIGFGTHGISRVGL